jgi:MFS family permease
MPGHRRATRWALFASAVFFALYVGNVLLGKFAAMQGALEGWHAGNVYEALFLFFAVIAFVVAAIKRENRDAAETGDRGPQAANPVGGNDGEE